MGNLTVKESGEMINFISPNVSKITSFKVHFSPRQEGSGDPSPDNVRNITGWSGVTATRCGKNLIDKTAYENIYTTYDYIDSSYRCKKIQLKSNTTYTVSFTSTGADANVIILFNYTSHVNGNTFLDLRKASGSKTYTTDDTGCLYIGSVNTNNDKYNARMSVCEIQIEEGLTATDYEPYTGQTYPITFPTEAGIVYGGYVDLISGELVADKAMKTFDGSETWDTATVSSKTAYQTRRPADIASGAVFTSNIITRVASLSGSVPDNVGYFGGTYLNIYAPSLSMEEWIAMLTATPLQIVYKLADPIIHQLTPQQLSTLKGQNNFWSNADYIEIEYELTETFDIQKAKRKIILNQPHVESASGDIVTFNTDMKGKLKECKVHFSPVQEGEGDPSPDNIRPISGWTGVNIYDDPKYGGNIVWNQCLDLSTITISSSSSSVLDVTTTETGFNVALNNDVSTTGSRVVYFSINWNRTQNHRYIFLCKISNTLNYSSLYFYHSNGSTNREYSSDANEQFFGWESYDGSTSETKTTLRLYIYGIDMKAGESFEVSNLMAIDLDEMFGTPVIDELYENTTTSTQKIEWFKNIIKNYNYHEYNTGEVTTVSAINGDPYISISINWTDNIGTVYGGYVDLVSGELVAEWYSVSTTAWEQYNQSNGYKAYRAANQPNHASGIPMLCNMVSKYASFNSSSMTENIIQPHGTLVGGIGTIYLGLDENIDISNVQLVWKLAEPIHYQLTPQQILTLKGINNIYSDTNGQTEIKYWKH